MTKRKLTSPERKFYGPQSRVSPVDQCICGLAFTHYWAHRETGHHKRVMREQRAKLRAAGLL